MKNRKMRISLILALCLLIASLVTVLIVSAEDGADSVTVVYANGVSEVYAEGDEIVPIEVPKDFAKYGDTGDAFVYTVKEGAAWSFVLDGKTLTELTVDKDMLGKTVYANVEGTLGSQKVFYTIHENIKDETVPEVLRGEFFIYGYDLESLIIYLSRDNNSVGSSEANEPRYRYLRQRDNVFKIKLYTDLYPTKFDPRWGSANSEWELKDEGGQTVKVQDRTWRGEYKNGTPSTGGLSASVYFDLNGYTLEIGSSESMHFGSMACTPYSMRFYIYSTVEGAVFSGGKSYAAFYADDDARITVGELDGSTVKYGQNLSVYAKMITHINYGTGVYLYGGRYYQVGANPDFMNISYRLYAVQNCEFFLADQSEAFLFFNDGYKYNWSATKSSMTFKNCVFYLGQNGTQLIREVSKQDNKTHAETAPVPLDYDKKYTLVFEDCEFYGVPTPLTSCYFKLKYEGDTKFSVGSDENWGTDSKPAYLSYLAEPKSQRELINITGERFTVYESCAVLPANEVACVQYYAKKTYWQPGATPFVYDRVVINDVERYVDTEGRYVGIPKTLEAGKNYHATDVVYGKRMVFAFIFKMDNGVEGYGLVGETPAQTGGSFAAKVGNLSDISITLLADLVLSGNVDFGTRGKVLLDMNGYKITVAEDAKPMGAVHRIGDMMELHLYSSRPGAVYENLSGAPIFSLAHGGKSGSIYIGDYEYKAGSVYSGTNLSFSSHGSFYWGYPLASGSNTQAMFSAKNVIFRYTGSTLATVLANQATFDNCKFLFEPKEAGAQPIAVATRADTPVGASFNLCTFYAVDGTNVDLFACVDKDGNDAYEVDVEQRVSFASPAFYNVFASKYNPLENVETGFSGRVSFNRMDHLEKFFAEDLLRGNRVARSSAEFYINGELCRVPLLTCAPEKDIVTVTFDSGSAGLGAVTEEWVAGTTACREDFIVEDVFVFTYGAREVSAAGGNRLTAGCKSLAPGAMQISLSLTGETMLNLWLPKDTSILSVTVAGVKTEIVSSLDYRGNYYLVQVPLTPEMLLTAIPIAVQNENRTAELKIRLTGYVKGLLQSKTVSNDEKFAVYALMELAEAAVPDRYHEIDTPNGYRTQSAHTLETPVVLPEAITSITFEAVRGPMLKISGVAGTVVTLTAADGTKITKTIDADGVCRFTEVPLNLFNGTFTVECGGASFDYGVDQYKTGIKGTDAYSDLLATLYYYCDKLLSGAAS